MSNPNAAEDKENTNPPPPPPLLSQASTVLSFGASSTQSGVKPSSSSFLSTSSQGGSSSLPLPVSTPLSQGAVAEEEEDGMGMSQDLGAASQAESVSLTQISLLGGAAHPSSDLPIPPSSPALGTMGGAALMSDFGSPLAYPASSPRFQGLAGSDGGGRISSNLGSTASSLLDSSRGGMRRGDIRLSKDMSDYLSDPAIGTEAINSNGNTSSEPESVVRIIWGTTVNISESINMFRDFLSNFNTVHLKEYNYKLAQEQGTALPTEAVTNAASDYEPFYNRYLTQLKNDESFGMNLDCRNLQAYPPCKKLYSQLLKYPQEIIPLMDHTLTELFLDRFPDVEFPEGVTMRVRPYNLGRIANLRELNPSDIDQLVTIKGLLIRSSPVIPDLKSAFFQCSVCDHSEIVHSDRGRVAEPTICPRQACKSRNSMRLIHNRCEFSDKQVCKVQETPDETPDGQTPYTVSMCMYDDLVDVGKPGDRVELTGIFRGVPVRVSNSRRTIKSLFKTYIDIVHVKRSDAKRVAVDPSIVAANEYHVDVPEDDRIRTADSAGRTLELAGRSDIYHLLSRSISPSIFGMEDVKKGVLLQLFGGSNKAAGMKPGAPKIRGDINILLVGDPGVSKSQLLRYVHELAPRGVYTSGKGSSAVGLTAYVTRDPDTRQLVLESGALVLSDGGVCCIDEFDKMSDTTRSVLHEVMEQQTISVAKAGIITTLNARTSILACANPINSKFDVNLTVPENVNLPPPLLSRFDLLYLILDKPNESDDRRLAQHLVSLYLTHTPTLNREEFLSHEDLARYINYAKSHCNPVLSKDAGDTLVKLYADMRRPKHARDTRSTTSINFTTRQLESMIRLSEAHAKMRLSATVDLEDVEEAHRLIMVALQTSATDPRTGKIDLDSIVTGISSSARHQHEGRRTALRDLIRSLPKPSLRWAEVYRQFNDQSDVRVTEKEFNATLMELLDEDFIHITGTSNADKVIRKMVL